MIKTYWVTFNSRYKNYFRVRIGCMIVKFTDTYYGVCLGKLEKNFYESGWREKSNMFELFKKKNCGVKQVESKWMPVQDSISVNSKSPSHGWIYWDSI